MPEDQFAAFEAIPGVGARLLAMYPELATLPSFDLPLAERLTRQLFEWLLPELEKITGVGITGVAVAVGGYLDFAPSPCLVVTFNGDQASTHSFMIAIGFVAQQTEVIALRPNLVGATRCLDIIFAKNVDLPRAWSDLRAAAPAIHGYMPLFDTDFAQGMRVIDESQTWTEHDMVDIARALDMLSARYQVDIAVDELRLDFLKVGNDWEKYPDGQSYLAGIAPGQRSEVAQRLADLASRWDAHVGTILGGGAIT